MKETAFAGLPAGRVLWVGSLRRWSTRGVVGRGYMRVSDGLLALRVKVRLRGASFVEGLEVGRLRLITGASSLWALLGEATTEWGGARGGRLGGGGPGLSGRQGSRC